MKLNGYDLLCRRDRNMHGGGIAVFGRSDKMARLSVLEVSVKYERAWILVHTDDGPFLACCWYRPPDENVQGIKDFEI